MDRKYGTLDKLSILRNKLIAYSSIDLHYTSDHSYYLESILGDSPSAALSMGQFNKSYRLMLCHRNYNLQLEYLLY